MKLISKINYRVDQEEMRVGDIIIKDWWLWGQIKLTQEHCIECGTSDDIKIHKGKELGRLIKILSKLNYKGIPKGRLK
jgi:hypothetical protein